MLEKLIAPICPESFRAEQWEKEPVHISRPWPDWCSELPNIKDIDGIVSSGASHSIRMVRTDSDGLRQWVPDRKNNSPPNMSAIYRAYAEGWTLIVGSVHRVSAPIANLAAKLRDELFYPIAVNMYFTPGGKQGFQPHFDGHDVFILQLSGSKRWRVYPSKIKSPLEEQHAKIDLEDVEECLLEVTLEAGSVLYIPRGFVHDGIATGEASLHLTIGIHPPRWIDLIQKAVAEVGNRNVSLRKSLPLTLDADIPELESEFRRLLNEIADSNSVKDAYERIVVDASRRSNSVSYGHFETIDLARGLSLESQLCHRPGLICFTQANGEKTDLHFNGSKVSGPMETHSAFQFIATTAKFCVADLPDDISDSSKVVICRRFVNEGLLELLHRPQP